MLMLRNHCCYVGMGNKVLRHCSQWNGGYFGRSNPGGPDLLISTATIWFSTILPLLLLWQVPSWWTRSTNLNRCNVVFHHTATNNYWISCNVRMLNIIGMILVDWCVALPLKSVAMVMLTFVDRANIPLIFEVGQWVSNLYRYWLSFLFQPGNCYLYSTVVSVRGKSWWHSTQCLSCWNIAIGCMAIENSNNTPFGESSGLRNHSAFGFVVSWPWRIALLGIVQIPNGQVFLL